jgi:hypothetical protein
MRYAVNPMFERGLAGLGDTADQQMQIDSASVLNVGDQLRQALADLATLEQALRGNPQLAAAISRDVMTQRNSLNDLITKYVVVYRAIFGNPPAGLGIAPILVAGAIAATFALVVAGLAVWWEHQAAVKQQALANTISAQNQATLLQQCQLHQQNATQAAAIGDMVTAQAEQDLANQCFKQAGSPVTSVTQTPTPPTSFFDWFQQNWITAALIAGAVIVIPKVAGDAGD